MAEIDSTFITISAAADRLLVSSATLRNWIRLKVVKPSKSTPQIAFTERDLKRLSIELANGKLNRLNKRANKTSSDRHLPHKELLALSRSSKELIEEVSKLSGHPSDKLRAIYLVQLSTKKLAKIEKSRIIANSQIQRELKEWKLVGSGNDFVKLLKTIRQFDLEWDSDLLSYSYQYLTSEGQKQRSGSFYTPSGTGLELVNYTVDREGKFLDPCCGSGNFLVAAIKRFEQLGIRNPWQLVYGCDIDNIAVFVARAQLTLYTAANCDTISQIRVANSLDQIPWPNYFEFIVTNPPWGSRLSKQEVARLKLLFPEVKSSESFSYFLLASIQMLQGGGALSFVLPESFLNVAIHLPMRKELIESYSVKRIAKCKTRFSGVFTSGITITVQKETPPPNFKVELKSGEISRLQIQSSIKADPNYAIVLGQSDMIRNVVSYVDSKLDYSLQSHSQWALGIVTGNNDGKLKKKPQQKYSGIRTGSDICRFRLKPPSKFLKLDPLSLQQCAPLKFYKCKEKLVYRFICKELVFAVDRSGLPTLNSANILIPNIPGYSCRAICGILNSQFAQFYYQNKFNSIKTLRRNLERFPFPKANKEINKKIEHCVSRLETKVDNKITEELNRLVLELYEIPTRYADEIKMFPVSKTFDDWSNS